MLEWLPLGFLPKSTLTLRPPKGTVPLCSWGSGTRRGAQHRVRRRPSSGSPFSLLHFAHGLRGPGLESWARAKALSSLPTLVFAVEGRWGGTSCRNPPAVVSSPHASVIHRPRSQSRETRRQPGHKALPTAEPDASTLVQALVLPPLEMQTAPGICTFPPGRLRFPQDSTSHSASFAYRLAFLLTPYQTPQIPSRPRPVCSPLLSCSFHVPQTHTVCVLRICDHNSNSSHQDSSKP